MFPSNSIGCDQRNNFRPMAWVLDFCPLKNKTSLLSHTHPLSLSNLESPLSFKSAWGNGIDKGLLPFQNFKLSTLLDRQNKLYSSVNPNHKPKIKKHCPTLHFL